MCAYSPEKVRAALGKVEDELEQEYRRISRGRREGSTGEAARRNLPPKVAAVDMRDAVIRAISAYIALPFPAPADNERPPEAAADAVVVRKEANARALALAEALGIFHLSDHPTLMMQLYLYNGRYLDAAAAAAHIGDRKAAADFVKTYNKIIDEAKARGEMKVRVHNFRPCDVHFRLYREPVFLLRKLNPVYRFGGFPTLAVRPALPPAPYLATHLGGLVELRRLPAEVESGAPTYGVFLKRAARAGDFLFAEEVLLSAGRERRRCFTCLRTFSGDVYGCPDKCSRLVCCSLACAQASFERWHRAVCPGAGASSDDTNRLHDEVEMAIAEDDAGLVYKLIHQLAGRQLLAPEFPAHLPEIGIFATQAAGMGPSPGMGAYPRAIWRQTICRLIYRTMDPFFASQTWFDGALDFVQRHGVSPPLGISSPLMYVAGTAVRHIRHTCSEKHANAVVKGLLQEEGAVPRVPVFARHDIPAGTELRMCQVGYIDPSKPITPDAVGRHLTAMLSLGKRCSSECVLKQPEAPASYKLALRKQAASSARQRKCA